MQQQATRFFFDDNEKLNTPFNFIKPSLRHQKDLNTPAKLSAELACKNLASNVTTKGHYALHNGLLAHYEKGISEPSTGVLELLCCRLKIIPSNPSEASYMLTLTKNNSVFELIFPDENTIDQWIVALRSVCIMTTFHDEFKAIKMIGKGGFAKVYLAESKIDKKEYAVKTFAKDIIISPTKPQSQISLINEINMMRAMNHDNIIKLHEVHETDKSIYLIMELIQGKPLQSYVSRYAFKKDPITERQIIEMTHSILDALSYIASKGIMHRDLKPDNILVENGGKIKIVDFGLATYVNVAEYIFKKCGTPGYIAPEVFRYDPKFPFTSYDSRCDVFSAGCILFNMLFGYPLFDGPNSSEVLELNKGFSEFQALYHVKKELRNGQSKINKEGLNLVLKLLEFDPKKRDTAFEALNHPFFSTPINTTFQRFSSARNVRFRSKNPEDSPVSAARSSNDKIADSLKSELSEKASRISASRNRFTQKDSLYLDVGKPCFNGKIVTITSNKSANASLLIKGNTYGPQTGEDPVVDVKGILLHQKNKGQSRSFKNYSPTNNQSLFKQKQSSKNFNSPANNQSFLKAAIYNTLRKKSEIGDGEKTDRFAGPRLNRRHTEDVHPPASRGTSSPSSGSEEFDDIGDEDCHIEANLAKVSVRTSDKHSKQKQSRIGKLNQNSIKKKGF